MTTPIVIEGLYDTTKTTGFFGEVKNPAGSISAGSIPLKVLLVGNKTSGGVMTADAAPVQATDADEVRRLAGNNSELGALYYGCAGKGGAAASSGLDIWIAAQTESSGAQATATITIAGSWSTDGALGYRVDGWAFDVGVGSTDTPTTTAAKIKSIVNAKIELPVTADNTAGLLTLTAGNKGPRGNFHTVWQDTSRAPTGLTSTLAGGSAYANGAVPFSGGTVADDATAVLASIETLQFDRIAIACGDPTVDAANLAKWKVQINDQAGADVGILGLLVTANTSTLASAATISTTTLNDTRFQNLHMLEGETHPTAIAGAMIGLRAAAEQQYANASYDDEVLPEVFGQTASSKNPSRSVQETALGEGVTEIYTAGDGTARISRSITTHCLNGTTPDYRCLDTGCASTPDFVLKATRLLWETEFRVANPLVSDNPPEELRISRSGVGYPDLWNAAVTQLLKDFEAGRQIPAGLPLLIDVDENLPVSQYNSTAKRIMSIVPVVPAPTQHQIGVSVRQVSDA